MAILIDRDSALLIQGITGRQGAYHTARALEYGTRVVAGVTPGKGGQTVQGVPVFDTVADALERGPVDVSMILVPPAGVLDAAWEAIDAGIPLIVVITEFVPYHDALRIKARAAAAGVRVVGPNTIGVISPGRSRAGIMPGFLYREGTIGIVSRSGTLTHEIASNLGYLGRGQSTCVCIGGDLVKGFDFTDALRLFRADAQTEKIVLVGEIGGGGEEAAARYIGETAYPKPVLAYIAGMHAPPEKRRGHAAAIVSGGAGTAASKCAALTQAGVTVARTLADIYALV